MHETGHSVSNGFKQKYIYCLNSNGNISSYGRTILFHLMCNLLHKNWLIIGCTI